MTTALTPQRPQWHISDTTVAYQWPTVTTTVGPMTTTVKHSEINSGITVKTTVRTTVALYWHYSDNQGSTAGNTVAPQ
jgi:hypothetical protein